MIKFIANNDEGLDNYQVEETGSSSTRVTSPVRGEKEKIPEKTLENQLGGNEWTIDDIQGNHMIETSDPISHNVEINIVANELPDNDDIAEAFDDKLLDDADEVIEEEDDEEPSGRPGVKTVKLKFDNRRANIVELRTYRRKLKNYSNKILYLKNSEDPNPKKFVTPTQLSEQVSPIVKRVNFRDGTCRFFDPDMPLKISED